MGIPVVISSHGGIPVRQVTSGAPVMTVATNGFGIPIVLSNRGLPFIVQGLAPAPSWSVQPSISGTTQVGQTLTGSDGTIANGTVTLRQWLNVADNSVLGTGSTLLLTEAMEGLNIKFKVTAVGTGGSATATSTQVGPVAEAAADVVITNAGYVFTNANGDAGQWYRDNVAISGQTGSSYTGSAASDEGHWIGQRVGGVLSNVIVNEKPLPAPTVITFDGLPDGTKLSALPVTPFTMMGGDTTNQDKYFTEAGSRAVASLVNFSGSPSRMAIAVRDSGIYHRILSNQRTENSGPIVISVVDASNYIVMQEANKAAGYFQIRFYINGVLSGETDTRSFLIAGSLNTGSYLEFEKIGDRLRVGVNGTWYKGDGNSRPAIADNNAFITIPTELLGGTYVGLLGVPAFYGVWLGIEHQNLTRAILVKSSEFITIDGVQNLRTVIEAQPSSLYNIVYFIRYADTGELVQDWTALPGAPGAPGGVVTLDIPLAPETYQRQIDVFFSDSATRDRTTHSIVDVPYFDAIRPFKVATQSAGAISYGNSDLFRDRARQGMWVWRGGAQNNLRCTVNAEGYPIGPMPSGAGGVALKLWEGGLQKVGIRTGPFRAEITNGTATAINPFGLSNITASGATSTGVTLTLDMVGPNDYFQAYIEYSLTSLPSDGFKVTCVPVGDGSTSADIACPQTAAIWEDFPWRDMKDSGAENAGPVSVPAFGGKVPFAIDYINKTGADTYYHNVSWSDVEYRAETAIRPWLESFRDNLLSTTCAIEVGNEVWNDFYQNQLYWQAAAGAQVPGCWAPGLIPDGTTVTNECYNEENNTDGAVYRYTNSGAGYVVGELREAITAGTWFVCSGADYQSVLVECKANAPIGAIVPSSGENTYFRIKAGYASIRLAGRLYVAHLQAEAGILGKSIMGDRCKSILGIFINDTIDDVCDLLEFNDAYLNIDHFSPSFYSGGKVAYSSLPSWVTSTGTTFADGYYALRRTTCDAMIANLLRLKHGVVREMIARGYAVEDIPTMDFLYEGLSHDVIGNIPSDQLARVTAEVGACHTSAREGAETAYMFDEMKNKIGGKAFTFADVAQLYYNGDATNGQLQQWGLRYHQLDGTYNNNGADEWRYIAAKAV